MFIKHLKQFESLNCYFLIVFQITSCLTKAIYLLKLIVSLCPVKKKRKEKKSLQYLILLLSCFGRYIWLLCCGHDNKLPQTARDIQFVSILLAVTQRREDAEGETVEMQQNPSETRDLIFRIVLLRIGAQRLLNYTAREREEEEEKRTRRPPIKAWLPTPVDCEHTSFYHLPSRACRLFTPASVHEAHTRARLPPFHLLKSEQTKNVETGVCG